MPERIDPDLFARLMRLSPVMRNDLLEYAGQTPVPTDDMARLATGEHPFSAAPGRLLFGND